MLKPETARTVLDSIVGLVFLLTGLTGVGFLWSLLSGGVGRSTLNVSLPASMTLTAGNRSYQITRVNFIQAHPEPWMWAAWLTFIALLIALTVLGYGRVRRLAHRLLDDPFAPQNAAELRLAARVALIWQGLTLLIALNAWWAGHRLVPSAALSRAVRNSPDVQVGQSFNTDFTDLNVFGLSLIPLLVAALLAILATVFQRGHDLREAERALRAEQELTV